MYGSCANTSGEWCCSMALQSSGYGRKGGYIQVGMTPPQVLIIYFHQPTLHMAMLHYQLRQQLQCTTHTVVYGLPGLGCSHPVDCQSLLKSKQRLTPSVPRSSLELLSSDSNNVRTMYQTR